MDKVELGEIGCTIRRLRTERNFTLKQLSDKTGIQMATLSRIENHKISGSLKNYFRIAQFIPSEIYSLLNM